MPTKKRRIGFIPRNEVLDIINKLSFESNLSISKIINILVEEALYERGIFNIKNIEEMSSYNANQIKIKNDDMYFSNAFNNFNNAENKNIKGSKDEFIDNEIYKKFLMFLQFQEKIKNEIVK